jgi:hypothetical protein
MHPRIFLSYSSNDADFADRLRTDLEAAGMGVVDVHHTPMGESKSLEVLLERALSTCEWVVVALTQDAVDSARVRQEVDHAEQFMARTGAIRGILMVQAGPIELHDVPPLWRDYKTYDATRDYAAARDALIRHLTEAEDGRFPAHAPPPAEPQPSLPPSDDDQELDDAPLLDELPPPVSRGAPPPYPPHAESPGGFSQPPAGSAPPPVPQPAPKPAPQPVPQAAPPPAPPPQTRGGRGRSKEVSAQTLEFSAFHPNVIPTGEWSTLLVYTYITEAVAQIQADAAIFTELGSAPKEARTQSTRQVRQGVELTLEPHMDGVAFSPESDTFVWRGDWRRSLFRLRADERLAGTTQTGWIDVYAGRMSPIASIEVAFSFQRALSATSLSVPSGMAVTANPFDAVFISYSHRDEEAMRQARAVYDQLGVKVLVDDLLEAGVNFEERLSDMIQTANVFHLLWSPHAAASNEVQKEWMGALTSGKGERFIRPWYWRKPLAPPPTPMRERKISFRYQRLKRRLLKPSTWF